MPRKSGQRNPTWFQIKAMVEACTRAGGMRRLADLLNDPPFEVYDQYLERVLAWPRDVGPRMVARIVETCPSVDAGATIGELSQREREIVAARLRGTAREIENDERVAS